MSRASTEMENQRLYTNQPTYMRRTMVTAVEQLAPEDLKAMVLASLRMANTYEMTVMAEATSFKSFENLEFELEL